MIPVLVHLKLCVHQIYIITIAQQMTYSVNHCLERIITMIDHMTAHKISDSGLHNTSQLLCH